MTERKQSRRRGDIWLAVGVLLLAGACFALLSATVDAGKTVEVTVDGDVVARLPLAQDAVFDIPAVDGENRLVIAGGKAAITQADCPDAVCVRTNAISHSGQSIVCLPHRVVVTITGEAAVDGEV